MASEAVVTLLARIHCGDPELVATDLQVTHAVDDLQGLVSLLSGADDKRLTDIAASVDGLTVSSLRRLRALAAEAAATHSRQTLATTPVEDDFGGLGRSGKRADDRKSDDNAASAQKPSTDADLEDVGDWVGNAESEVAALLQQRKRV
eukprot:TRINITY_DN46469_c0_g1_i1.p2 TRINITY_DN46469_c0_g1~~TRINITY_DN46469_c0_g1_i1.p2  ORF type:complete len:148 (-),score=3.72 TRINITY_DN46469_c0_g1_i1:700-1143(-)